ncbi:MAG TPA: membrane protein insertase YidC [Rudaea sp.]|jgi:YidC/Oxa1 family membrane protein insertase
MNSPRPILFFAVLVIGFFLWQAWQQDYAAKPSASSASHAVATVPQASTVAPAEASADVPTASVGSATATPPAVAAAAAPAAPAQRVDVRTDLLHAVIDTRGGSLVEAELLAYPIDPNDRSKPVRLLDDGNEHYFVVQSGLVSSASAAPDHRTLFNAEKTSYQLAPGADTLEVPLTWRDASGVSVRKVYIFKRASYLVATRQEVTNATAAAWTGNEYRQLQRVPPVVAKNGLFSLYNPEAYAFAGAAIYSPQDKFQKLAFAKFADSPLRKTDVAGGWVAMLQHYFFAAWIADPAEPDQFATEIVHAAGETRYLVRSASPALTIAPNETKTFAARLYVGPKLQSTLDEIAPGLALTVDYGILTFIASPLHWILVELHSLVRNWGLAIIFLVLLIKLAMFKLSEAQFRSMAKMKRLQPRLEALKERYGDDKQKYNAAMMELYQKEKINPLGGCLPLLVQIPVFFALYWVLLESVELRQAPFFGWIQNLSAPDPYFILPILNAIQMILTQRMTPTAPGMDPMQARMMKTMPLIFSVMLAFAPAGLTLYWAANGWLSLLQQWIITKRAEAGTAKA